MAGVIGREGGREGGRATGPGPLVEAETAIGAARIGLICAEAPWLTVLTVRECVGVCGCELCGDAFLGVRVLRVSASGKQSISERSATWRA